jgi:hypothetical protein
MVSMVPSSQLDRMSMTPDKSHWRLAHGWDQVKMAPVSCLSLVERGLMDRLVEVG